MTPLQALRRRLADLAGQIARAVECVQALDRADPDDLPLTAIAQARLLVRVDELADAVEVLTDDLALAADEVR